MEDRDELDRRQFLKRASMIGAAVAGTSSFLVGCDSKSGDGGGKPSPSAGTRGSEGGGESGSEKAGGDEGGLNCEDPSDLSEQKMKTRKNLKYVDESPKDGKVCDNCNFWQPPENDGECGGCQVLPGPVHPKGYCTSWAKKS